MLTNVIFRIGVIGYLVFIMFSTKDLESFMSFRVLETDLQTLGACT